MIELDFKKAGGLIPAIVQDASTGEILMLAYMNQQAFEATLRPEKPPITAAAGKRCGLKGRLPEISSW